MKAIIDQYELSNALSSLASITPGSTSIPIIQSIKLDLENDKATLSATDLNVGMVIELDAKVESTGSICVPAKLFSQIASLIQSNNVTLHLEEKTLNLEISYESGSNKIPCMPSDNFPKIRSDEYENEILIEDPQEFIRKLKATLVSVSTDQMRPSLTGININGQIAAIDGHRLTVCQIDTDFGCNIIVPGDSIQKLVKISDDYADMLIRTSENMVEFDMGSTIVSSNLIVADFVQYEGLIPKQNDVEATVGRKALLHSLSMASVFSRDTVLMSFDESSLSVMSTDGAGGQSNNEIESQCNGEMTIRMNASYLVQALNTLDGDTVTLGMTENSRPMTMSEGDVFHMLMPIGI